MLSRLGPPLAVLLLAGPILAGFAGTLLPAFGYLPALGGDTFTLDPFRALFAVPGIGRSALASFWTGLASAAISLALVLVFVAAWAGTPAFSRIQHLVSPLLAVPHAAAAFGLAFLIAPSGLITRLISPELTGWTRPPDLLVVNDPMGISLIAGLVAKETPFLLLVTLAALQQVPLTPARMVAASLGYGRMAGFVFTVWPLIYRQIRLAVFAVIAFASSVVDVAMILGPTTPPTVAVRLVHWMNDPDLAARYLASAGALLQLGVTAAALVAWIALERMAAAIRVALTERGRRMTRDRIPAMVGLGGVATVGLATFAGLAALCVWSIAGLWQFPDLLPRSFRLDTWQRALPRIAAPLAVSLVVALGSTLVGLVVAVLCLRRETAVHRPMPRQALALVYLPLIVPQAAFLFGLQLLFLLAGANASLSSLILAHLVFVMPYLFLSLSDPWRAFDRRYEHVAAGLGRSPSATFWRIRLPMMARPILVAAAIGFAVSIGLYLPTVLVGAGRLTTVTTEAVALASGGNRRVIGVWAVLQLALPLAGFAIATLVPAVLFARFRGMRV
ncbi:MAG: ABC transporter permease [Rhizobiaceae bacterium]|nr:ABC transporter permease [Rhizobiaceae bacterium]MCV0405980.1 ABC transporter permease [Rhizobiaceae bacterium]